MAGFRARWHFGEDVLCCAHATRRRATYAWLKTSKMSEDHFLTAACTCVHGINRRNLIDVCISFLVDLIHTHYPSAPLSYLTDLLGEDLTALSFLDMTLLCCIIASNATPHFE